MPAHIISNSRTGEKAPRHPFKQDGEFYRYLMYFDGNSKIAYTDDLLDLYDLIFPGYSEKSEDERLKERINFSLGLQEQLQAVLPVTLPSAEWDSLKDWEKRVIAGEYNEERPYFVRDFWKEDLPEGVTPDEVAEEDRMDIWLANTPLVLTDVLYEPFSDYPKPLGNPEGTNIAWIKASDEDEFLKSLNFSGYITVKERASES